MAKAKRKESVIKKIEKSTLSKTQKKYLITLVKIFKFFKWKVQ